MREEDCWINIRGEGRKEGAWSNIELIDDSSMTTSSSTCAITTSRIVSLSIIFESKMAHCRHDG